MEPQPAWPIGMTAEIGGRIAFYRQRTKDAKGRRMTAQALAARCRELGLPIGRPLITKLERGIRQNITVAELLVIARALNVAPVQLVVPVGLEDKTAILPGLDQPTWRAAMWFTGESDYPGPDLTDASRAEEAHLSVMNLFRQHEGAVNHWITTYSRLRVLQDHPNDYLSIEGVPRSEQELRRTLDFTRQGIRDVRQAIRARDLTPPQLPPELASVDRDGED